MMKNKIQCVSYHCFGSESDELEVEVRFKRVNESNQIKYRKEKGIRIDQRISPAATLFFVLPALCYILLRIAVPRYSMAVPHQ